MAFVHIIKSLKSHGFKISQFNVQIRVSSDFNVTLKNDLRQ